MKIKEIVMTHETAMEKIRAEHAIAARLEYEDEAILANHFRRELFLVAISALFDLEKAPLLEIVREYGTDHDIDTLKRGAGL